MRISVLAAVLAIAATSGSADAAEKDECVVGNKFIARDIAGFRVTISRYHDPKLPPAADECRVVVRDEQKHAVFSAHDYAFALVVAGQDVNGDGIPDIVLEGYSGGMHGTSTYYVISLGEKPRVILKLENEAESVDFIRGSSPGPMEIHAWDGAFFRFDETCSACSPYPMVYLQMDGTELRDISAQHRAEYDKLIREMRRGLPPDDLARFRVIEENWDKAGEAQTGEKVLNIALAYLYSGRESQAHKAIREMWPAFDQDRIWTLILKTRRRGLLRYVSRKAP